MNLILAAYFLIGSFLPQGVGLYSNINTDEFFQKIFTGGQEDYYNKGMEALAKENFKEAESLFKSSVLKFNDAPSHFELAKLYLRKDTYFWRNKALEHFRQSVMRDPDNIDYRYAYAKLLEDFARFSAIDQYKKIIDLDHKQVEAWNSLARLKEEDFKEFHNSVRDMGEGFMGSLEEYAQADFEEAESYLLKSLSIDSLNFDSNFKLGKLYENASLFDKAISYFNKCSLIKAGDKDTHLYLGLLNYKTSEIEEASRRFQIAFSLMDREERKEYTYESAKLLLEPAFEDIMDKYADWETEQFIKSYWDISDPLYLTGFNERIVEHYARVAFAKLHFTVEDMGINGWQSNMGEFVLRYGEPRQRMRIRPQMTPSAALMKTEVWYFDNMTLAFTDFASSGNFQYSAPTPDKWKFKPQFSGDSQWFAENLKTIKHEEYKPRFEGPVFDVPFNIAQFRSTNDRNQADVYINYGLNLSDSAFIAADINYDHQLGLFFFDKYHNELYKTKRDIKAAELNETFLVDDAELLVNSTKITVPPDSGMFAFELMRDGDKGVSANRFKFKARKFTHNGFNISDILLGTEVEIASSENSLIKRGDYSVLPNPAKIFNKNLPLFIYYEIYNLQIGTNRLTDFQQEIVITKLGNETDSGNIFTGILSLLGLTSDDRITFTSDYQTQEKDPQLFLQIDMNNYEPGDYMLSVNITDSLTGKTASSSTSFRWE